MRVTKHLSEWACVVQVTKGGIATDFFGCSCPLPSHLCRQRSVFGQLPKKSKNQKIIIKKKKRKKHAGHALLKATAVVDLTHHL